MHAPLHLYKSQSIEESLTPPKTPPELEFGSRYIHPWPEPETGPEQIASLELQTRLIFEDTQRAKTEDVAVAYQEVLLLHGPKQRYAHTREQPVPKLGNDREMLVEVQAVGLNPIDWKAPDFGFGLPALPCISGRDLAGKVVKAPKAESRFRVGDIVMAISTDYRDSRKAAYQQYSVVSDFNACKLPASVSVTEAAPVGVAFAAAALALGICIGTNFAGLNGRPRGPDLLRIVRSLPREALPEDIQAECFDGIKEDERPRPGDWIVIWGGSSATGRCAIQLAKSAELKVIAVIDAARSGGSMLEYGADLLVDRIDTERAISVIKGVTKGRLRFGFDTNGRASATLLARAMQGDSEGNGSRAHLIGLTGLPKEAIDGVVYHSVPIKSFHEAPRVGEGLMIWLEKLLEQKALLPPEIEIAAGGLAGINAALDRLRDGSVNGPRIVVPLIPQ